MKKFLLMVCIILVATLVFPSVDAEAATKVKINKKTVTTYAGQSTQLKVSKGKAKWSSSKKSVVVVNSKGKITAKKTGVATITAKVAGQKVSCKVTVKKASLSKTKLSLNANKNYTLKMNGAKVKVWSSSNKNVAAVNKSGKITAKKVGSVVVTAKCSDGKKYNCKVVVTKAVAEVDDDKDDTESTESKDTEDNKEEAEEHMHVFQPRIIAQPTCTEYGKKEFVCECGRVWFQGIQEDYNDGADFWIEGGAWVDEYNPATGDSETYHAELIAPVGHDYKELENTVNASGIGHVKNACSRCQDSSLVYYAKIRLKDANWAYQGSKLSFKVDSDLPTELKNSLVWSYTAVSYSNVSIAGDSAEFTVKGKVLDFAHDDNNARISVTLPTGVFAKTFLEVQYTSLSYCNQSYKYYMLENKIQQIIASEIKPGMTDREKVKAIHDWMCKNVKYDWDGYNGKTPMKADAYSALIDGYAVCDGYAGGFALIMNDLGISTIRVRSQSMLHAWNKVLLEGQWYWLDVTWDSNWYEADQKNIAEGKVTLGTMWDYFLKTGIRVADEY